MTIKKLSLSKETLRRLDARATQDVLGGMEMSRAREGCVRTENGCGGNTIDVCGDSMVKCTLTDVPTGCC